MTTMNDEAPVTNRYGDDPPSEAVVDAVAAATGKSMTELDPLYRAIDSDSLDGLFARHSDTTARFRYEGCDVRVTGSYVVVRPTDDADSSQSE